MGIHLKMNFYPRGRRQRKLLTFFFMFILFVSSPWENCFSESNKKLTIKYKEVLLTDLLKDIEQQSDYAFIYKSDDLSGNLVKNINFENSGIESVLKDVLLSTGFSYKIVKNHIIINKASKSSPINQKQIELPRTIKGMVLDEKGQPLPGATILIQGTTMGVATNEKGEFSLDILGNGKSIIISYLGYKSQTIVIKNQTYLKIKLDVEANQMEDVVVTGIITRKSESYTGAARTMKKEELIRVGNKNLIQSLGYLDPSFQILEDNQQGSDPNRIPDIQMRGASSFSDMKDKYQSSPNQPLFIVDGFEQSIQTILDMDMNRVESITLLKDATAKALYGSKGANGVVVIETTKPRMGQMTVSYVGSIEFELPDLTSYNLCNAKQKLEVEQQAGVYSSSTNNPIDQSTLNQRYEELHTEVVRGVNTYWLDKPLRTGIGNKHSLNLEGGDAYMRYQANVYYNNTNGVMKESGRENYGGNLTLSYRFKTLLFKEQILLSHNKSTNSPYGAFSDYAKLNPYWRAYNEDGSLKEILDYYSIANQQGTRPIYNPMINAKLNTTDESKYTNITNNLYVEWTISKSFKSTARLGITHQTNEGDIFLPRDHTVFRTELYDDEEYFKKGLYTKSNGKSTNYNLDLGVAYNKLMNKHQLLGNFQWSMNQMKSEDLSVQAQGFANNKLDYITHASQYKEGGKPIGNESLSRGASALLALSYSYNNKYLFDANYRGNASSLFGSDNRWGHFWSLGIGWNIHNEKFLMNSTIIQQLKLRASTGYTGSQNFNSYQAISTYRYFNDQIYDNIIGSYLMSLSNPDLKWQRTQDDNIGFDANLFKRVDISFDYYIKTTKNLLTPVTLPPSVGFGSYTENLGKSENKGIELRINYRVISDANSDVHLNLFGTLMHNKNTIKKINNALQSINDSRDSEHNNNQYDHDLKTSNTKPSVRYKEGASMNAIWAVKSLGIDPGDGHEIFITKEGVRTKSWNADDQQICGDALPKVSGTLGFNVDWKGFSVSTNFFYKAGGDMYNQTLVDKVEDADIQYNVDYRLHEGRWTTPGKAAKYKYLTYPAYFTRPTSRFVQKLNEIEMTTLNVGYDFRNWNFIKKGNLERLKLSFYLNNLFKVSSVDIERGTAYPFARSGSFQVQLTF